MFSCLISHLILIRSIFFFEKIEKYITEKKQEVCCTVLKFVHLIEFLNSFFYRDNLFIAYMF